MADMPTNFWSGWILVVTAVSLIALFWLVVSVYFSSDKSAGSAHGKADPVWDENLKEGTHPPPLWWFWLVFSLLIISVIYLILFPGLGAYKGLLNWSQDSRLISSYAKYDDHFNEIREKIDNTDIATLRSDAKMMASADRIFQQHCSGCHGQNAKGQANLFPSLVDSDWQWGGSPELVEQTIRKGRVAGMPPWQSIIAKEDIEELAGYVKNIGKKGKEERPGHGTYMKYCAACHGADGKGNQLLGAPDLTDLTWLYGHSIASIEESIKGGRKGQMPAFEGTLDDTQIRLLIARFSQ